MGAAGGRGNASRVQTGQLARTGANSHSNFGNLLPA